MVEICLASSMNNHDETNNSFPFPFLLFIYHLGTNQLILRDIYSRPCMSCMSRSIDIENFLTLRYFMSKNGKQQYNTAAGPRPRYSNLKPTSCSLVIQSIFFNYLTNTIPFHVLTP
jgi:hypothetical protein